MVHKKEDFIRFDNKFYRCICADKEFAIFARVSPHRKDTGYQTHLNDLFCCGQTMLTTIYEYERIYRGKWTNEFPRQKKAA